jgi:dihydropteroate synthase
MGVVNITPDSFSDGGKFFVPEKAYDHARRLVSDGADIIDFGAESTRPGAKPVSEEDEWSRLWPVLDLIVKNPLGAKVSVDTAKPGIMERLLDYPVDIVNDVGGARQPKQLLKALARSEMTYLAMHMHLDPETMQMVPLQGRECLESIRAFFQETYARLASCGFEPSKIWLDPGIGFGKTDAANLKILAQVIRRPGDFNIAIGISRKSFLGRIMDIEVPEDRDPPSKTLEMALLFAGVKVIRTHNVKTLSRMRSIFASEG